MGFLKKLLGIGVVAGTTVAAVKVADKVKENNPDGDLLVNRIGQDALKFPILGIAAKFVDGKHFG